MSARQRYYRLGSSQSPFSLTDSRIGLIFQHYPRSMAALNLTVAVITNVRLYRDALAQILGANSRFNVFCVNAPHDWQFDWVTEIRPDIVLADGALV
ncbi:MAG TPA: hypothetical protein VK864_05510, partial [Longimicrobiales bacterium]|nr:hypothetical protein [Longimicrobiales bacterium]